MVWAALRPDTGWAVSGRKQAGCGERGLTASADDNNARGHGGLHKDDGTGAGCGTEEKYGKE